METRAVTAPYPRLGLLVSLFEPGHMCLIDSSSPMVFDLAAGPIASTATRGRVAALDGGL